MRWILRKLYTVVHALFASFWFYFVPFSSIALSYAIPFMFNADSDVSNPVVDAGLVSAP